MVALAVFQVVVLGLPVVVGGTHSVSMGTRTNFERAAELVQLWNDGERVEHV